MKYILLHGMGQNASSWDETVSYLSNTVETICPELSDFLLKKTVITLKCIVPFVNIVIIFLGH